MYRFWSACQSSLGTLSSLRRKDFTPREHNVKSHIQAVLKLLWRVLCASGLSLSVVPGFAADLKEPITIASENGALNLLMVAKAAPFPTLSSANTGAPTGWVYDICRRPADNVETCPENGDKPNHYGGTLLQLQKGDVLRVHFVNQLPLALDSKHALEPGREFLRLNPTNIHTHGMLVSPHSPSSSDPTYGDNVFVLTFNPLNGKPELSPHMHSEIRYGSCGIHRRTAR